MKALIKISVFCALIALTAAPAFATEDASVNCAPVSGQSGAKPTVSGDNQSAPVPGQQQTQKAS